MVTKDLLQNRLDFMQLDSSAQAAISGAGEVIRKALPGALDHFYAQVRARPETRRMFSDEGRVAGAKAKQIGHWDAISRGQFDEAYTRAVTEVGKVHARIGLEPRWYIGGYAILLDEILSGLVRNRWPKRGLMGPKSGSADQLAAEVGAVAKATLLDMDLAISVYFEAAEAARREAEAATLAAEREQVVETIGAAMSALAAGDLTYRLPDNLPPEYARLRADFNAAAAKMSEAIGAVAQASSGLNTGIAEIAAASDDLSRRTEQQAAGLEETAAALDEITATVARSTQGAQHAAGAAAEAKAQAARSGQVVEEAVAAMSEIEQSSHQIGRIIGVIDEIAFQTNLLALNAGVEAARAGDSGKGFAVVASEVRGLAQRSADAAREIKALIAASSAHVERGVRLVAETGETLGGIVEKVTEIDVLIGEMAQSSGEQATGLKEVNTAVNQMDQVTQQNAAMVEQATAAANALRAETQDLMTLVGRFRTEAPRGYAEPLRRSA